MPCFWHVLCCVYDMCCGLNWEDNVVDGQGLFWDGFGSKLACTGASKELSGTLVRGSHTFAWLGSKFQPSGTQPLHTFKPPTSNDHNFFIQTLFQVFLDSMESPLSQDSNNIPVEDIR